MCLICTVLCGIWEWTTGRHFTIYLSWDRSIIPNAEQKSSEQIAIISFFMFFSYLILLNTVVPISLYVRYANFQFVLGQEGCVATIYIEKKTEIIGTNSRFLFKKLENPMRLQLAARPLRITANYAIIVS